MKPKRLVPIKKIPELYPEAFTKSSMRWLLYNRKTNGFDCCVRKIGGKKILIDLDDFEAWIDKQQGDT